MAKPAPNKPAPDASDPRDQEGPISERAAQSLVVQADDIDMNAVDATLAVSLSRLEIDVQIATAHQFPRSPARAIRNIIELATNDTATAIECMYTLPRGKDDSGKAKMINGPSIRLAELIAQQWGNCRYYARVTAIDRKEMFIEAEGMYHDLETNSAIGKKVRRRISDSRGRLYNADMIGVTGNAASSIALRNAILGGVPRPIWRQAYAKVEAVIRGDETTLGARRVSMLQMFKDLGAGPRDVFALLGVAGEQDIGLNEMVSMTGIYSSLKNGETTVQDLLRQAAPSPQARTLSGAYGGEQQQGPITAKVTPAEGGGNITVSATGAGPAGITTTTSPGTATVTGQATGAGTINVNTGGNAAGPVVQQQEIELTNGETGGGGHDADGVVIEEEEPLAEDDEGGGGAGETQEGDIPAEVTEAFEVYEDAVIGAETWAQLNHAMVVLANSEPFKQAPPAMIADAYRWTYDKAVELQNAGEAVSVEADPFFFWLWTKVASPTLDEVNRAFARLIRTDGYRGLPDAQRQQIARHVAELRGEA